MDTAMKKFVASPSLLSLLSLEKPELLEVVNELGIEEVKPHYRKCIVRKCIGVYYCKTNVFLEEELKFLSNADRLELSVTPVDYQRFKFEQEKYESMLKEHLEIFQRNEILWKEYPKGLARIQKEHADTEKQLHKDKEERQKRIWKIIKLEYK